jgi:uncharacterized membrane protein YsdA (DUF1294 family)/cold shock CspA family protein
MRFQGRITNWKDDQGFGFIAPNDGGNQVFVHIKSFSDRRRRPEDNEIVTYEIRADVKGRAQAANVAFVGDRSPPVKAGIGSLAFAAIFVMLLAIAALAGKLPAAILFLYLIASAVAFLVYAFDKSAAMNNRWRTPESTLHFLGVIGGWPGALAAQSALHHKSKKESFQTVFRVTVVLNCGALGWLLSPFGTSALRSFLGAA